eukprot:TRINITY_DN7649_c0_g1_i1.p1 TRINITY_DN7649_c0_g1~~TRINITY_DN7649_c0_g1_i1.p1  ORF type:complete len:706 (-),score=116.13 TRINITY_DN7649_c0_g1_i1:79-2196(-)
MCIRDRLWKTIQLPSLVSLTLIFDKPGGLYTEFMQQTFQRFNTLQSLSIEGLAVSDQALAALAEAQTLSGVTRLQFRSEDLRDEGVEKLLNSRNLTKVTSLSIQVSKNMKRLGKTLALAASLKSLNELEISANSGEDAQSWTGDLAKSLAGAEFFDHLTSLSIIGCSIPSDFFESFGQRANKSSNLTRIRFSDLKNVSDSALRSFAEVPTFPKLQEVSFLDVNALSGIALLVRKLNENIVRKIEVLFSDKERSLTLDLLANLSVGPPLPQLEVLNLAVRLDTSSLTAFANSTNFPSLKELSLVNTGPSDEQARQNLCSLFERESFGHISTLRLKNVPLVEKNTLRTLRTSALVVRLEELSLSGCRNIPEADFISFFYRGSMKLLRHLDVSDTEFSNNGLISMATRGLTADLISFSANNCERLTRGALEKYGNLFSIHTLSLGTVEEQASTRLNEANYWSCVASLGESEELAEVDLSNATLASQESAERLVTMLAGSQRRVRVLRLCGFDLVERWPSFLTTFFDNERFIGLKVLDLEGCHVPISVAPIFKAMVSRSLTKIILNGATLAQDGITSVPETLLSMMNSPNLGALEELYLSSVRGLTFNGPFLKQLLKSAVAKKVNILDISNNQLSSQHFNELRGDNFVLEKIEVLNLARNNLTADAIKTLLDAAEMPRLREMIVSAPKEFRADEVRKHPRARTFLLRLL